MGLQEQTFQALKIKKNLIFQKMELFSFIFFLYFGKWKFPAPALKFLYIFSLKKSTLKKFLIFSQKNLFLHFGKMELLYFRKWNFLALSIKRFRRKLSELKKFKKKHSEKMWEMELSSLKL